MQQNAVEIVAILDRSGSMCSQAAEAIAGFNAFLEQQQELPGEATLTVILFNNGQIILHDGEALGHVPPLDYTTYVPRGSTALFDAVGRAIVATGEKLARQDEADRPGKVVVVVVTDGEENSSREYTGARIKEMIGHQQDKYGWTFIYLGTDPTAYANEGQSFGHSAGYRSVEAAYANMSRGVSSARCNEDIMASLEASDFGARWWR